MFSSLLPLLFSLSTALRSLPFIQFSLRDQFGLQVTSLSNQVNDYDLAIDLRSSVDSTQITMLQGPLCNICEGDPKYEISGSARVVRREVERTERLGLCDGDEVEDGFGYMAWAFRLNFTRAYSMHNFHALATLTGFVVLLPIGFQPG
jgi:hypothetical protein